MLISHPGAYSKTGRPDFELPYRPGTAALTVPLAPRNLMLTSPYLIGKADVRWDNPRLIPQNAGLNVVGCNVYRATDSPYGTYVKVNNTPVGVLFYRDETVEDYVSQEDVTASLVPGTGPDGRWLVYTSKKPIIIPGTNGEPSVRSEDVTVEIDDGDAVFLEVPAYKVNGILGEIQLISSSVYNYEVNQDIPARLPTPPTGRVRVSYRYLKHSVLSVLNQRIYYKVTTVAVDPNNPSLRIETPIEEVEAKSLFDIEAMDYIWTEAIRRNRWILEQGGERVKIFIRKWMGEVCECYQKTYGQGRNDCELCYGTGVVGGYEGPYDAVIAPPEAEKSIDLSDMGLHVRYDFLTWLGPWPLINERDVIVRQNNHRFIIGPVNPQGQRGAIFQQHFTISQIDEGDIRYRIPITGGETSVPESTDLYREEMKTDASPVINAKPEIPLERIFRGKTVTWENISWVFCVAMLKINVLYSLIWNQIL